MLYQEQVMQIAQAYAGFTLGKADLLRRAMSKKNLLEMQKMEEAFVAGAKQLGRSKKQLSYFLNGWKNLRVMALTVVMPLLTQP